jgi:hypothetical protein
MVSCKRLNLVRGWLAGECGGATRFPRVLHGELDDHAGALVRLNEAGADIFVMINAGDGVVHARANTCRTTENVTRVRAMFATSTELL